MTQPADHSRDKRVDLILQQLEELPTLPTIAVRVLEATANDESSAGEVVRLITSDVSLTARILQLVHRADSGVRGEVASVERAVILLGFEAVRSAVLAVSVFQVLGGESKGDGQFSREEFWKHSVSVACCAELLAERLDGSSRHRIDPSEAFTCGLLHDLGKVALDAVLPKSFSRVVEAADLLRGDIADVERTVIGLDHMVVGKRLAERWQLPQPIRDCIWLHGQLPQALPSSVRNPRLVNLITLADLLVREQHLGYSGNYSFTVSRQPLIDAVGLEPGAVEETLLQLVEGVEPRARALGLGAGSTSELYQQALARANRELGRVSGQLASKNRRLSIRAKFFDALSGFQGELRPDAGPQAVLQAVGQTAVGVLGVKACAVFSLSPGSDVAETALFDDVGDLFASSLVDGAERPDKPSPGDGPVIPVGRELEWLLAEISPRLSHDRRFWIRLEADGECIGGVVWGAPVGEGQRLSPQVHELAAIASGWSLALRTAQIREEARNLSEQLAESNRQLHSAQNELLRTRTLISLGEMAAGAAHEMNNPLAVISGRSQLLASQLSDAKLKHAANLIFEQSHRLTDIITELMHFAKPEPPRIEDGDFADLIDCALQEAKRRTDPADRSIEVTMGEVPVVRVDPRQVVAAIAEIIGNALHATDPVEGRIAIHAAFDPYSSRIVMTVADNGVGMDDETVRRAFDPFFSSRPAGRRRGMGLAKAARWIEASGGSIRIESQKGQGARVMILLPAARAGEAVETPPASRKAAQGE